MQNYNYTKRVEKEKENMNYTFFDRKHVIILSYLCLCLVNSYCPYPFVIAQIDWHILFTSLVFFWTCFVASFILLLTSYKNEHLNKVFLAELLERLWGVFPNSLSKPMSELVKFSNLLNVLLLIIVFVIILTRECKLSILLCSYTQLGVHVCYL